MRGFCPRTFGARSVGTQRISDEESDRGRPRWITSDTAKGNLYWQPSAYKDVELLASPTRAMKMSGST